MTVGDAALRAGLDEGFASASTAFVAGNDAPLLGECVARTGGPQRTGGDRTPMKARYPFEHQLSTDQSALAKIPRTQHRLFSSEPHCTVGLDEL